MTGPGPDDEGHAPSTEISLPPDASDPPVPAESPVPSTGLARPGASTFTIEGRQAPALFVVGWLATILGLGMVVVAAMAGAGGAPWLAIVGLVVLSVGLIAAGGSQGVERRARAKAGYQGPSPLLVFASAVPVSLLGAVLVGIPLDLAGIDVTGAVGRVAGITIQTLVYIGLIRLLVVDAGALTWAEMGLRRLDRRAVGEFLGGALWAVPVIFATAVVAYALSLVVSEIPDSPLPATGETTGFVLQLVAGALIAPFGEELLFRGLATTAWVRDLGVGRGVLRAALVFAFAHVIGVTGATAGAAAAAAGVAFAARVPVALALGWLFVRRGSIWASFGLHAAFNGILLILAEAAFRSGAG